MLGVASPAISYGSSRALIGVKRGKAWSQNAQNVHFLYIHLGIVWVFLGSFSSKICQETICWVHFGYTLGTLWVHFFEKVYLSWVQFGSFLGCFFPKITQNANVAYTLGTFWVHFGYSFSKKCTHKPKLGYTLGTLWVRFGYTFWKNCTHKAQFRYTLGTFFGKSVPKMGTLLKKSL